MPRVTDEQLATWVLADIESADNHYLENIEPAAIKKLQRFLGDKEYYKALFPRLSARSSVVMTDIADTIYWILPSLMRVFFGGQDVVSIEGRTPDDNPEAMRELVNWQIQRKNRGFLIFYRWFIDALIFGMGVVKPRWVREVKEVEETVPMSAEQFLAFDDKAEGVKLIGAEEQPDGSYAVTVKRMKTVKNQPVLDNVPISEFRWLPDADEVSKLSFCCHTRLVSGSDIRAAVKRKEYQGVTEEALAEALYQHESDEELQTYLRDDQDTWGADGASAYDKSREQYWLKECYGRYDIDGDGISEYVIVTMLGSVVVRKEINEMERPLFGVVTPAPGLYQIDGFAIDDFIGELQDVKTAMVRQIILNIANNNDRQAAVDEDAFNASDLAENKRFVRYSAAGKNAGKTAKDVISYFPEAPLSPMTMPFLEYVQGLEENRTGVTRYNQGLDAKSLNKTATGITAIMGAANQRIEMIARIFAETGVLDVFKMLVEMNSRYIDQEQVVRLTEGKFLQIKPDDLSGDFDLDIAAGIGAGQRQEATQNMMLLLSQIYPAMAALGVAPTPENVHEAAKVLVEQMGYKDAMRFVPDLQQLQQQQMMMQQMMQQGAAGMPGVPPTQQGVPA